MNKSPLIKLSDGYNIPQMGLGIYKMSPDEVKTAVNYALRVGYRHIDTAAFYNNEADLGEVLAATDIKREDLFITTKLWKDQTGKDRILKAFDTSLKNLKLEYIDLYLIHWQDLNPEINKQTWETFVEIQKSQRVKSIGVSNFTIEMLDRLQNDTGIKPVVNQIELHPRFSQTELRAYHQEHNIVTVAWSPLGRGTILNDPTIISLAKKYQITPAQVILDWHLQLGNVTIPKSVTPERIKTNFDSITHRLDAIDIDKINSMNSPDGRDGADPAIGF